MIKSGDMIAYGTKAMFTWLIFLSQIRMHKGLKILNRMVLSIYMSPAKEVSDSVSVPYPPRSYTPNTRKPEQLLPLFIFTMPIFEVLDHSCICSNHNQPGRNPC